MTDMSALPPIEGPEAADHPEAPLLALPLRFIWQSDDLGRLSGVSPELLAAMGPGHGIEGKTWDELMSEPGFDPAGELARALARRDTWSGVVVHRAIGNGYALKLELAGLPVFDRDHTFRGYRGFGVVREAPFRVEETGEGTALAGPPAPQPPEPEPPQVPPSPPEDASPVLPFRRPSLNPEDDHALREIARALAASTQTDASLLRSLPQADEIVTFRKDGEEAFALLDALPGGVLIHRLGMPLFANRAFLDLLEFEDLGALIRHSLDDLFDDMPDRGSERRGFGLRTATGRRIEVEAHLKTVCWEGEPASLLFVGQIARASQSAEDNRARELAAMLDIASDGVVTLDAAGRILSANRGAELMFGYESVELEGRSFTLLLGADSHRSALEYLDDIASGRSVKTSARPVIGAARRGGAFPLVMTLGRISQTKFCAVLRDVSDFHRAEQELRAAKARAEELSAQKSDFLARVSHEVRTPLNAILGFAEVMLEEKFGPLGSERYRDYLREIHDSGEHVISLVNDLLDLAKIEAGRMDLNFVRTDLNQAVAAAVSMLQPEANANRVIIRTSLAPDMPRIIADERSLKQIAINLVANAVKYTRAGGQVIVSTALTDLGQAVLRVRDTGAGMTEEEIAIALEPFRQLPSGGPRGGTGLGLPLTKALVEANRAHFSITSAPAAGTLVEISFPPSRILPA